MSQNALSRELALRIGLAARALPDTSVQQMLTVLTDTLGLPLTEEKLATLNLKTLKTAGNGAFSHIDEPVLKKAVHALKHPAVESSAVTLPEIMPYQDGDMQGSIRIACATNDLLKVDGHFGSCEQFMIYQVSATESRLIAIRSTQTSENIEDDKNRFRAELIKDCQVLYLTSIGGPAAAKIIKLGIHPVKLTEVLTIADVLSNLQQVLTGAPPPWLAKVMGISAEERVKFAREAEESESEAT
jgi:nitrogen fixation protein NifX